MPQVNVEVNGRSYKLTCGDGEQAHVLELAQQIDKHAKSLGKAASPSAEARVLVMAALMLADEVHESKSKIESLKAEVGALKRGGADTSGADTERAMADLLDRAAGEIETAAEQIAGRA